MTLDEERLGFDDERAARESNPHRTGLESVALPLDQQPMSLPVLCHVPPGVVIPAARPPERETGIEPVICSLATSRDTTSPFPQPFPCKSMEQDTGIEPVWFCLEGRCTTIVPILHDAIMASVVSLPCRLSGRTEGSRTPTTPLDRRVLYHSTTVLLPTLRERSSSSLLWW